MRWEVERDFRVGEQYEERLGGKNEIKFFFFIVLKQNLPFSPFLSVWFSGIRAFTVLCYQERIFESLSEGSIPG